MRRGCDFFCRLEVFDLPVRNTIHKTCSPHPSERVAEEANIWVRMIFTVPKLAVGVCTSMWFFEGWLPVCGSHSRTKLEPFWVMLAISPGLHPYWAVFQPEDGCLAVQQTPSGQLFCQPSWKAGHSGIILHGSMASLALKVSSAEQSC